MCGCGLIYVSDCNAACILFYFLTDKFPQLELLHSLDIWHKAKKLSKCIHQAARVKGCESLKEWIDDVVSHFWFCCQNCEGRVKGSLVWGTTSCLW
ncbi:uncharacterized protein LOC111346887 [Stylophora pistillata]|uniref:uncharacterized protein LOC111346887 n=1 Tax=Stylophora pistillata TaxID=50429 RepID=UPI000C0477B1|nr:uncharacterized protein LOC111346887 [Stylophora pistillata]